MKNFKYAVVLLSILCQFTSCKSQPILEESYTQLPDSIYISKALGALRKGEQGYSIYLPKDRLLKGAVVIISNNRLDMTEPVEEVAIINPAIKNNLAVLFISTGTPVLDFLFEEDSIRTVDRIIGSTIEKYGIPKNNLIFIGLSLAGTRAMKYAIYCEQNKSKYKIHPKALAISDSPLDFIRFWDECQRAIDRNYNELAYQSAFYCIEYLKSFLGGPPELNMEKYISYSPYCYKAKSGGNAKILADSNLSIRAYHEPDVNWWITNRGKDYYSMNSLDLAALINDQQISGNKNAELITTVNKRKGANEGSSPHTWSNIDNDELVKWFLSLK